MKKRIAIIGTNGIPSNYGGFETLVEYLAEYLSGHYDITVFCSGKAYDNQLDFYKGCKLVYIPLSANNLESIFFDSISILRSLKFDKLLILGCSGAVILPFLFPWKKKLIMNLGGLDWQRSKWGFFTRKFLKFSEMLAIKYSADIISDNIGIQEYILEKYKKNSKTIAYGGDQALKVVPTLIDYKRYPFLDKPYVFSLARIQKDNNIEMILDAFTDNPKMPIVFVGNWKNSDFGIDVKAKYEKYPDIILLDAIYDPKELGVVRSNCALYIHGHSAGGTNPALVEAMNIGLPILAYDVNFNRYTTENNAEYFKTSADINNKVGLSTAEQLVNNGVKMEEIASRLYKWKIVADGYAEVFDKNIR